MSTLHHSLSNSGQGPQQLGNYRLLRELGRGGMGVVYLGVDRAGRQFAIKVMLDDNLEARRRFAVEARACERLQHPNVVRVFDVGESGGRPYVVMELLAGESLQQLLKRAGALSPERAARVVSAAARGLSYAHSQGILHRDIKPDNLMLCGERVVLADFGLARDAASEQERLTRTGQLLGTPAYMAPEQADGAKHVDLRCDIYALGATLYALLVGAPPFRGSSVMHTLRQVLEQPAPLPSGKQPGVPAALDRICRTCMSKDPEERYADAAQLADDLDGFLAPRSTPGRAGVGWVLPAVGVGLLLVLGAVLTALLLGGGEPEVADPPPPPPPPPAVQEPDFGPYREAIQAFDYAGAMLALPKGGGAQGALYRADALLELRRPAEARAALSSAADADPVWLALSTAWAATLADRPQATRRAIELAREEANSDPAVWVKLARILSNLADPRAREVSERALELAPREPLAHVVQGRIAMREAGTGEAAGMKGAAGVRRARESFERALELDPDCSFAQRYLVYARVDRREWAEAHHVADRLVARFPRDAWARFVRGWAYKQQGTYGPPQSAVGALRRATEEFSLAMERGYAPSLGYLERGYTRYLIATRGPEPQELELAEQDLLASIELNERAHSQFVLTLIYEAGGKHELAVRAHERAIELEPQVPTRYLGLFQHYERRGNREAALATLERCVARCPVGAPGRDQAEQRLRANR